MTRPKPDARGPHDPVGLVRRPVLPALILASIPVLPDLFSNDPAVISLVAFLFIHVALWQPIAGIVFALDGILIGAGDLRFLAIAMVAATAVLIAGSFAVLGLGLGIGWLWVHSAPGWPSAVRPCTPAIAPTRADHRRRALSRHSIRPTAA